MNEMMRRSRGLVEAVKGTELSSDQKDQLNAAIARFEAAAKAGNDNERELAHAAIYAVVEGGQATGQAEAGTEAGSGFDGGVRRAVRQKETNMNAVIGRAAKPWSR